jgi:hypothetical protein
VLTRAPFVVLRKTEPDHRPTLRADKILARQPDVTAVDGGNVAAALG